MLRADPFRGRYRPTREYPELKQEAHGLRRMQHLRLGRSAPLRSTRVSTSSPAALGHASCERSWHGTFFLLGRHSTPTRAWIIPRRRNCHRRAFRIDSSARRCAQPGRARSAGRCAARRACANPAAPAALVEQLETGFLPDGRSLSLRPDAPGDRTHRDRLPSTGRDLDSDGSQAPRQGGSGARSAREIYRRATAARRRSARRNQALEELRVNPGARGTDAREYTRKVRAPELRSPLTIPFRATTR